MMMMIVIITIIIIIAKDYIILMIGHKFKVLLPFCLFLIFHVGHFFKVFLKFVTIFFCFMFQIFGHQTFAVLVPQSGNEPAPLILEGEVLTTRPPGKSPFWFLISLSNSGTALEATIIIRFYRLFQLLIQKVIELPIPSPCLDFKSQDTDWI